MLELAIEVPPFQEQVNIACLLGHWDTAVQKIEQLIAAKEREYQILSSRILWGLSRFGSGTKPGVKSLHWFSIANEWDVRPIGDIAHEVSELNRGGGTLPVFSCTKHDGLVDSLRYFKKRVFSHDTSKYKVVGRGQFAYATNHIEEGSIGYQDLMPAGLVSPIYTVFKTDSERVHDGYLYKVLKTERLRQLFAASTNASVDRRGSLRWKEFARIQVPVPPLEEQRRISDCLDTSRREVELLRTKAEALRTQKRGLMQKLLTGQWRLPLSEQEPA